MRKPILGTGDYTYEATHNWGTLPKHIHWGDTHGVVFDEAGLIYFTHQSAAKEPMDAIAVFDKTGRFIRSFGKEFHGGGHGLAIRKEGKQQFLYMCDIKNCKVAKLSLKGEIVWSLGVPKEAGVYKKGKKLRAHQRGLRPRWRILRRRRLRFELPAPVRQGRQVGPHLGRPRAMPPAS